MYHRRLLAAIGVFAVLASGCGGDGIDSYGEETESQFLATCVGSLGEAERSVCVCSYERIVDQIPYDDFADVDRRLNDDPDADLPEEFAELVIDCAADPTDQERRDEGESTTTTTGPDS